MLGHVEDYMPRTYDTITLEGAKRMLSAAKAKAANLGIVLADFSAEREGHELPRRAHPDRESEPFYNKERHLTKSFEVDLGLGKHRLNLLQTVVRPGQENWCGRIDSDRQARWGVVGGT